MVDSTTYAGRATGVTVTINNAVGDGEAGEGDDVRVSTERVTGTTHDDDIRGEIGAPSASPTSSTEVAGATSSGAATESTR